MYKNLNHDRPYPFWCLQEPLMMCSLYKNKYMQMYLITINNMRNANICIKHNNTNKIFLKKI